MALLRELLRARALEERLARIAPDAVRVPQRPRAISPAVPAARALHRASDGSGDVFSLRVGSPAASLVMGMTPKEIFRQALGRGSAVAGGRDPGGFPTDFQRGTLSPVDLPGTLVEVLSGIALSFRLRGERRVALLVDDMAGSASGDWHEGLNFAAVRQVPMVLVVDHTHRRPGDAPVREMRERAEGYGFGSFRVQGTDPRAVEREVWRAVEEARGGGGLQVVDVDPPERDPVEWLTESHQASGALSAAEVAERRDAAEREMEDALRNVESEADRSEPDAARRVWPPEVQIGAGSVRPWSGQVP